MAADKTIWECPVYTLYTQLSGAMRLVIQPSSDAMADYGVPLNLLGQWIFSNNQIGVYGGSSNPDNALGNNGDVYFQSNGQIKQKSGGTWSLKATVGGSGSAGGIKAPFTSSNLAITDWQGTNAYGQTSTWAVVLGNNIRKPTVYVGTGVANHYKPIEFDFDMVMSSDLSQIISMTFDWAVTETGYIQF